MAEPGSSPLCMEVRKYKEKCVQVLTINRTHRAESPICSKNVKYFWVEKNICRAEEEIALNIRIFKIVCAREVKGHSDGMC